MKYLYQYLCGLLCVLTAVGCAKLMPDNVYYMGQDREVVSDYLGHELPTDSEVWAQIFRPADFKAVTMIIKLKSDQSSAEALCRGLDLKPASRALLSPLPIVDRDTEIVRQWWTPPKITEALEHQVAYESSAAQGKGQEMRAVWLNGYLYIYKQGPRK